MGACCELSSTDGYTRDINNRLEVESKKEHKIKKLLFLGPGGSGKSTIFRQLQWLHGHGFSKEDCLFLRSCIYFQIISQMQDLLKYYTKTQQISTFEDDTLQNAVSLMQNTTNLHTLTQQLTAAITYIWAHSDIIKNAFDDANACKYQILDETTEYFWNDMDRVAHPQYVPTETDIINVRYRTTGMVEKYFTIDNMNFRIIDVGGQKSERKKWIHCFNEVSALIFVIALSGYNEMMYEDSSKNCMVDALDLFGETVNNKWFPQTHIVLFLNKKDLFKKKIAKYPITDCSAFSDFSEYKLDDIITPDAHSYHHTTEYIKKKFEALNEIESKRIYMHITYAMDRGNVENIFGDVVHIVTTESLSDGGFI